MDISSQAAALRRAIQNMGSAAKLAAGLGITDQAVGQWKRVPPGRVLAVEKLSGVPRHELRPDIYPPEEMREAS